MPAGLAATPAEEDHFFVITRTLKAPRALVWKMFSDPYHLAQWWGPKGFSNRVEALDFRTGGRWRHVMIAPDGTELPIDNTIIEATPIERLVYRNAPADPALFGDNPPPAFTKTLTFTDTDGGTLLTLLCSFDSAADRDRVERRGFRTGTDESFDKLERHLSTLEP